MLKKIKAIFFIKTVFLYLKEVKKLKIVRYNKKAQKKYLKEMLRMK